MKFVSLNNFCKMLLCYCSFSLDEISVLSMILSLLILHDDFSFHLLFKLRIINKIFLEILLITTHVLRTRLKIWVCCFLHCQFTMYTWQTVLLVQDKCSWVDEKLHLLLFSKSFSKRQITIINLLKPPSFWDKQLVSKLLKE